MRNKRFLWGRMKHCYMFIAFICCYLTLRQLSGQISESIRMLCYVLCLFSIDKLDTISDRLNKVFDKPWKKVLQIILEFYGTFAMTGMYFLYTTVAYEINYPRLVYFLMSFCWVCPMIQYFIALLIRLGDTILLSEHQTKLSTRCLLMGIMMVPCILFLVAFNPAITSPDSENCFNMAHNLWQPDISISDWHPPFYIFILSLLLKIRDSISFLIIIQGICFAAVFVDGILFLYQCGFSKKILGAFYIFITFGVSNIIQLTTLWKDIPYTISLMWLTLLLMKLVMRTDAYQNRWSWYVQLIASLVFTGFFRQNGILPALAVIVILPVVTKFSKKVIFSSIACILLIVVIKGSFYKSMNVVPVPQLKFFSLANDIMYSYYTGADVSEEAMEMIYKITDNAPDNWGYNPYYVKYNSSEPSGYSVASFLKIYCRNIIQNPKKMVMAMTIRNSVIWSIARPTDEAAGCVNYLGEYNTRSPNIYPLRVDNGLTEAFTDLCGWIRNNTVLYLFLWRTGIYNLLILFMAVVAFCSQKGHKLFHMMPYVPILANLVALFISSGWTDYRYFWPSMPVSLFLLFFFLFGFRNRSVDA